MKNSKRLAIIAAVILAVLTIAAMAGLHYAARELKAQVQQALGPDSEVGETTVRLTSIEIRDVRVRAPKGWPAEETLRARRIVVVPDLIDLISAKVRIDRITAEDVYLSVWRSRDGRMRLLPSMLEKPGPKKTDPQSSTPVIIGVIELKDGVLEFFDTTVRQPAHKVRLEQLQAKVKDITMPSLTDRTNIELNGIVKGVHRNGTLAIHGWAELSEKNSEIATKLRDVDLIALQPYLIKASETGVRSGTMNFDLKSTVRKNRLHAPGTLTLSGLELAPGGAFGTFMGVPRQAVVASLKDRNGQIVVKFTLEGNLDNPQFSLNENLALRLGTSVAGVLGISVGNLAKGVGINAEGLGGAVKKLFKD